MRFTISLIFERREHKKPCDHQKTLAILPLHGGETVRVKGENSPRSACNILSSEE